MRQNTYPSISPIGKAARLQPALPAGLSWFYRLMNQVGKKPGIFLNQVKSFLCTGAQRRDFCILTGIAGWFLGVVLLYATSIMLIPVAIPVLIVGFLCGIRTGFFTGLMVLPGYLLLSIWSGVSLQLIWSTPLDLACMLILGGCGALTGYMHEIIHNLSVSLKESDQRESQIRIHQMRLRALTARMALNEERKRYDLTQNLTQGIEHVLEEIKQSVGVLSEQLTGENKSSREALKSIDDALVNYQYQSTMISPPMLYQAGLETTLGWLASRKAKAFPFQIHYTYPSIRTPINNDQAVLLYHSVGELLDNIRMHANATDVEIDLHQKDKDLVVVVRDNGQGFDTSTLDARPYDDHGYGLFAIKERVSYAGGSVQIQADPEAGTCITIRMPIKSE